MLLCGFKEILSNDKPDAKELKENLKARCMVPSGKKRLNWKHLLSETNVLCPMNPDHKCC